MALQSRYTAEMRTITAAQARHYLLGQCGLNAVQHTGPAGVRAVLSERRHIQLDPLDAIGENAELVVLARVDGIRRGQIYDALYPGAAFEHFAKERCILPADNFPAYRDQAVATPWWRSTERMRRLPEGILDAVEAEFRERGPLTKDELDDRGAVRPVDWSGWKSTSKAASLAVDVLWRQARVVVSGRTRRGKRYDLPSRALDTFADPAPASFERWALRERVEAAGLLRTASGPHWSMLSEVRKSPVVQELLDERILERVQVKGSRRSYLAPRDFLDRPFPEPDDRTRILGPLDPVLWDRDLIRLAFDFEYIWEVYKPKDKRRWGWYVCPVLQDGRLVSRVEARTRDGRVEVLNRWDEPGAAVDDDRLEHALRRLDLPDS